MCSKNESSPARKVRTWSLAVRLTAWYTGTAFALVALASGILYWALVTNLEREDDEELTDKVHLLRQLLRDPRTDLPSVRQQVEFGWASRQHAQIYVRVREDDGSMALETKGMSAFISPEMFPRPFILDEDTAQAGSDVRLANGKTFRVVAASCEVSGSRPKTIQIALDRTPEVDLIENYRLTLWIVLGTAFVLSALVGYQIAHRGLRPLQEVTATAGRIRASNLRERLREESLPAELAALAGTFNDMLHRLQESFDQLSRFSADIAHELRTPVNNLRGEVEVALAKNRPAEEYRDVLGSCLEESVRLSRLIDSLLFLARSEHPETQIEKESLYLAPELAAIQEFYEPKAAEAGVTITMAVDLALVIRMNRALLQRAITNLIDNAIRHTPAGGNIVLSAQEDERMIRIEVADTGCGIQREHLPHLFDRFYRVDSARSAASGGVGLGLAIVKGIVELHRGSVFVASESGLGTRITLCIPKNDISFANGHPRHR